MSLLRDPAVCAVLDSSNQAQEVERADEQAILQDIDSDEQSLVVAIPFLQQLHQLIRTCQFTAFWAEFNGASEGAKGAHYTPSGAW